MPDKLIRVDYETYKRLMQIKFQLEEKHKRHFSLCEVIKEIISGR